MQHTKQVLSAKKNRYAKRHNGIHGKLSSFDSLCVKKVPRQQIVQIAVTTLTQLHNLLCHKCRVQIITPINILALAIPEVCVHSTWSKNQCLLNLVSIGHRVSKHSQISLCGSIKWFFWPRYHLGC